MFVVKREFRNLTHVFLVFYLLFQTISPAWIKKYLTFETQGIILRFKHRRWTVKYYINKTRGQGGLSGGWMKFSLDNNLEESDVCVFKLANPVTKPVTLDVQIFRVVNEITPLTRATGSNFATPPKT